MVRGVDMHVVAVYSPWVNGLGKGTNGKLLGRLKRCCAPELGEDGWEAIMLFKDLPRTWPDHFDAALSDLNNHILPVLHYSPNEILTGHIVNTRRTPVTDAATEPTGDDVDKHMAYAGQQQLDTYTHTVEHAAEREAVFNVWIDSSRDLVQVYRSDLDYTFRTNCTFLPKWWAVCRVVARDINSYKLATLEGLVLKGWFSTWRLCMFQPREGTNLDDAQKVIVAVTELIQRVGALDDDEEEDVPETGVEELDETAEHEEHRSQPSDVEGRDTAARLEGSEGLEGDRDTVESKDDEEPYDDGLPTAEWGEPGRLQITFSCFALQLRIRPLSCCASRCDGRSWNVVESNRVCWPCDR